MNLLANLKVVEFCQRLPGPLAGYLLACEGASVTKVEDVKRRDPFEEGEFFELDPRYRTLYQTLNEKKTIHRCALKSGLEEQQNLNLIQEADIILVGLPQN